jgi:hypothetical protein
MLNIKIHIQYLHFNKLNRQKKRKVLNLIFKIYDKKVNFTETHYINYEIISNELKKTNNQHQTKTNQLSVEWLTCVIHRAESLDSFA